MTDIESRLALAKAKLGRAAAACLAGYPGAAALADAAQREVNQLLAEQQAQIRAKLN